MSDEKVNVKKIKNKNLKVLNNIARLGGLLRVLLLYVSVKAKGLKTKYCSWPGGGGVCTLGPSIKIGRRRWYLRRD